MSIIITVPTDNEEDMDTDNYRLAHHFLGGYVDGCVSESFSLVSSHGLYISWGSPEKQPIERVYVKEMAISPTIVGAGKSEIHRADQQAENSVKS